MECQHLTRCNLVLLVSVSVSLSLSTSIIAFVVHLQRSVVLLGGRHRIDRGLDAARVVFGKDRDSFICRLGSKRLSHWLFIWLWFFGCQRTRR